MFMSVVIETVYILDSLRINDTEDLHNKIVGKELWMNVLGLYMVRNRDGGLCLCIVDTDF